MAWRQTRNPRYGRFAQATMNQVGIEDLAMTNIYHSIDTMNTLKRLGVSFSMDDFGTGHSSLSYLHQLPIDEL